MRTGKQIEESMGVLLPSLDAAEIKNQLNRILASPDFQATEKQKDFLHFVVSETLAGKSHEIKGYTVATRVFGRNENFDPNMDPIVSIQANKLRRALERYYLTQGRTDPILIAIPKGAYVPTFTRIAADEAPDDHSSLLKPLILDRETWPTVMVLPFQNLTGDQEKEYWAIGFVTELAVELARYQEIKVLLRPPDQQAGSVTTAVPRFVINGAIRVDENSIKVNVQLLDALTYSQIWADVHHSELEPAKLIAFQEKVARVVAVKIAGEYGVISKTISNESRNIPPTKVKTYEAILRYYEWAMIFSAAGSIRVLQALEHAANLEPHCGHVWTMLGRLHGDNYAMEIPGFKASLEKAVAFSEKGVSLNPDDQRARVTLSYVRMLCDENHAAKSEVERALDLNPNSLFMLDGIGYLLTLLGDWVRGPAIIRKVIKLNPYYGPHVHYALFVDFFHRRDYEGALLETLNFRRPTLFWEPLLKAVIYGQLGRYEDGKLAVGELLKLKPSFPAQGRRLIRYYIKFDDIFNGVLDGLSQVGLTLD